MKSVISLSMGRISNINRALLFNIPLKESRDNREDNRNALINKVIFKDGEP